MICKWCGRSVLGGPLPNGYCSSECEIEELQTKVEKLEEQLEDGKGTEEDNRALADYNDELWRRYQAMRNAMIVAEQIIRLSLQSPDNKEEWIRNRQALRSVKSLMRMTRAPLAKDPEETD